jgi:Calpain family cysteine protease
MYTVTLWDLKTWKEVDIVIDERLPVMANGSGKLLASRPSEDGELWVCYLEKALAAHCGGWDKITGGQCTHAWALLTGCKEQYTISRNPQTGKFTCSAKYDPYKKQWARHANCPHESDVSTVQGF